MRADLASQTVLGAAGTDYYRPLAAAPTFSVSVRRLFLRTILICSPYQS
ncbi:hypothetical protein LCGC14_2901810, partial [marine sediment metagenome]